MNTYTLTSLQRKELRAAAHHLNPIVMIGSDGLTDAVINETDIALNAHGLIKIRVFSDEREERLQYAETLCQKLNAALVQHIGKLIVLFRPIPEKELQLELDKMPAPRIQRVVKPSRNVKGRVTVREVRVLGNERVTKGGLVKRKRPTQRSSKKSS